MELPNGVFTYDDQLILELLYSLVYRFTIRDTCYDKFWKMFLGSPIYWFPYLICYKPSTTTLIVTNGFYVLPLMIVSSQPRHFNYIFILLLSIWHLPLAPCPTEICSGAHFETCLFLLPTLLIMRLLRSPIFSFLPVECYRSFRNIFLFRGFQIEAGYSSSIWWGKHFSIVDMCWGSDGVLTFSS